MTQMIGLIRPILTSCIKLALKLSLKLLDFKCQEIIILQLLLMPRA